MAYNLSSFKEKTKTSEAWLQKELGTVRTGRANPSVLDTVKVESYGQFMSINQVAAITSEDPRTIRIVPWDASQVKPIEKAITTANLGLSVSVDEKGVRVSFPALTTESRTQFVKMAKEKLEHARITLRKYRDEVISDIDKKEKEGGMGKDEHFKLKQEVQKIVDEVNKKLSDQFEKKEKEIMS
ncbi:MAG TPA: ribosome recycling factor [Candidatus Paceibacterota bacterium]|jgi:ribosome recycling factor|nr:ribosome recycling factor [Candidatus Paceibacterota bacterium]